MTSLDLSRIQANQQRTGFLEGLDLRDVPFSAVPLYGYDHCQEMSTLAHYIGEKLNLKPVELKQLKTAALMHDAGRETPWTVPDPYHARRSADLADKYLRAQTETWAGEEFRERVCWLIANHDLSARFLPAEPQLQALWDADSYDAARIGVGTLEGMKHFRDRTARLCTDWARNKENQRVWMRHRKWD